MARAPFVALTELSLAPQIAGRLAQECDLWASSRGIGYTPQNIIMDGTTDNTATIQSAFSTSRIVRLPATDLSQGQSIKFGQITIPSGCLLIGAGMPIYDRVSAWGGYGTLVRGEIIMTGSVNAGASDFGNDVFSLNKTAIVGKSDATKGIRIRRIATRANDHGQLWEKNSSDPTGAVYNDIVIDDCTHYGGPNGIAVKMRDVIINNTVAYDVTVQAFPIVSDTINGATSWSRAQDVTLSNCNGINCLNILHVYSRDNQSTTNANGVLGAKNIVWSGGSLVGATGSHGAEIGDPSSLDATMTRIKNIDVWVLGARVTDNNQAGIFFETSNGGGYDNCFFDNNGLAGGANGGVGVQTSNAILPVGGNAVDSLTHGRSNSYTSNSVGYETGQKSRQADTVLTGSQNGIEQTNYLAAGAIAITLPAPVDGQTYKATVTTGQILKVVSAVPATNRIRNGSYTYANGIQSASPGSTIAFEARTHSSGNLEWFVTAMTGYWNDPTPTVANLPAASTALTNARTIRTDSSVAASGNYGATVAGGGANTVPVVCNGTAWIIG